ncbi:hypothetical protein BKA63DRAFT_503572 [Paraphoma chrysanthemicola]|nr:hypothetical protein BKA63DRAFT_503572 [Paraphoma chrysanthemicola]
MAETALGALGFCLGGLSFILNTVPAAARFTDDYRQRKRQIEGFDKRLALCQSRYITWQGHWRSSGLEERELRLNLDVADIVSLKTEIDGAIRQNTPNPAETRAWQRMKDLLGRGIFRRPRVEMLDFCNRIRFALWQRQRLEGWLGRLETALDVVERLYEKDFHARTADHFDGKPSLRQAEELAHLETFAGTLMSLATDVYDECMGTTPWTYAWALGISPPTSGHTILDWKITTPVSIELLFSVDRQNEENGHYRLHVCYQEDDPSTHKTNGAIAQLIQAKACGSALGSEYSQNARCNDQDTSARRTFPLGRLLKNKPHLFKDRAWLSDRGDLIYGLSEWSLLLWNSPWFEKLCCSGLLIEVGTQHAECARQIYDVNTHDSCRPQDHHSRLRNLGIVWAQLILGVPIRLGSSSNRSKFEQWKNGVWEQVFRSQLNAEILAATSSKPLQQAVNFCLDYTSPLPDGEFRAGYLYMCLEKIYKP